MSAIDRRAFLRGKANAAPEEETDKLICGPWDGDKPCKMGTGACDMDGPCAGMGCIVSAYSPMFLYGAGGDVMRSCDDGVTWTYPPEYEHGWVRNADGTYGPLLLDATNRTLNRS